jgi:hypothetical protein
MHAPSAPETALDPARLSATEPPPRFSHWPSWCLLVPLAVCAPILYAAVMAAFAGQSPEQVLFGTGRPPGRGPIPLLALALAALPVALGLYAWSRPNVGAAGNAWFVRWRLLVVTYAAAALAIALFCSVALLADTMTLRGFALLTGASAALLWVSLRQAAHAEHRFNRHIESRLEAERRRFAALRLLRQGLARDGLPPTRPEVERRAQELGLALTFDDYLRATAARTRYFDALQRALAEPDGPAAADVGCVRTQVRRLCLAGLVLKSDLANELLGVVSRTVLRVASLIAIFVMGLMLVLGFKNIIQALYAETAPVAAELLAGDAPAVKAASKSSVTLKSAIKAVEYLLLAAMPYLLIVSLTRYVYSLTAKDPDAASSPAEIKAEQAEVKAYWVSLLIGVLAASMIEQTLDPAGLADEGGRQKALIVCLVMGVLVAFFVAIKLTAGKGGKDAGAPAVKVQT